MGDHFDVLIIGAGLSGVGAAWRLRQTHPERTYAILEARDTIGGTWDLFRYPGVRSDSDMFTLSYPFRPWNDTESLASGDRILEYVRSLADEGGITEHIRFGAKVVAAEWSTPETRWTVRLADGTISTCRFLYVCAGYYDYDRAHRPEFPGEETFEGRVVHPQFWPEDLDHRGKRVVVVGSGATAITLVPAMAPEAAHVTMLQRSPTYVTSLPRRDRFAGAAGRWLPPRAASRLARVKNLLVSQGFYQLARRHPDRVRRMLRRLNVRALRDPDYIDRHFTPRYQPWDQRLCVIPEGDLFAAIRRGDASVVTDRIDTFVPEGIRLRSGATLEADVVVTATGLALKAAGGLELTVDGRRTPIGGAAAYRGIMLGGVPNFAYCIGYVNASWTLRTDLVHRYVVRLLRHMDRHGYAVATPRTPARTGRPLLDLSSGYIQRALDLFPRQGDRDPWLVRQNYLRDALVLPRADVTRDMTFARRTAPERVTA